MLNAYRMYLKAELRSLQRHRKAAEPQPPVPRPPRRRGFFGRTFGPPDEDMETLRRGVPALFRGGRSIEDLDDEIEWVEAELASLDAPTSWTRDEIEHRLARLRRKQEQLDTGAIDNPLAKLWKTFQKDGEEGAQVVDALFKSVADSATAGERERLAAAIHELELHQKSGRLSSAAQTDTDKLAALAAFFSQTFGDTRLTFELKKKAAFAKAGEIVGADFMNKPEIQELLRRFGAL